MSTDIYNKPVAWKINVLMKYISKHWFSATIKKILELEREKSLSIILRNWIDNMMEAIDSCYVFDYNGQQLSLLVPPMIDDRQEESMRSTILEVFANQIYKKLKWDRIVDIWWYFGESGLYFGINNENSKVYIYEPQTTCFDYIKKNCKGGQFEIFNNAVAGGWNFGKEYHILNDGLNNHWIEKSKNNDWSTSDMSYIKVVDISYIIKSINPDCIKIDIEWWEYPVCMDLMNNQSLLNNINNWIIEFHNLELQKNNLSFMEFLEVLKKNGFKFEFIDDKWRKINKKDLNKNSVLNLYFCR